MGVAPHVLRFWETKFPFIRPLRRAGGRRFYRPADIQVLTAVRRRLHEDGYSIRRLQGLPLKAWLEGDAPAADPGPSLDASPPDPLAEALARAVAAKARLDALLERSDG